MAALTPEHRFDVLRRWKASRESVGFDVPSDGSLETMAITGSTDVVLGELAVSAWKPTLDFLLHQLKMGVGAPDVPAELESPTGPGRTSLAVPAPASAPASGLTGGANTAGAEKQSYDASTTDRMFRALKAWRDDQVSAARAGIENLKASQLRSIATLSGRDVTEIAARLPASVSPFADEMAAVLEKESAAESTELPEAPRPEAPRPEALLTEAPLPSTPGAPLGTEQSDPWQPAATPSPAPQPAMGLAAATPAATTAAATASAASTAVPAPVFATGAVTPDGPLDSEGFAPFAFAPADNPIVAVSAVPAGVGSYTLSWPPFATDQSAVVYRVVSSDDYAPYNPDLADVVATTWSLSATDARPFASAVRHVQVWLHVGADLAAAKASAPIEHARGGLVAQPLDVDIREDEGRVIGQWTTLEGATRVQVYRIPISRGARGHGLSEYRILSNDDNLTGFVDSDPKRGSHFLYSFAVEATVDEQIQLSAPIVKDVLISDVLEPVLDLAIDARGDEENRSFDLTWTPPTGGKVAIYRTAEAPRAGIEVRPVAEEALSQANLRLDERLAHPVSSADGRSGMRDVPWPSGWTRAYFTPVTLLGGQAFVGTTISHAGPRSIAAARIVERVNKQVLTFSWPEGAASVQIYGSVKGASAEAVIQGGRDVFEVSAQQYKEAGGFTFPVALPTRGCDIHLVPVAFQAGDKVQGAPTTITYPGLTRLRYELKITRNLFQSVTGAAVSIYGVTENVERPTDFVLIHNPDRFPLSVTDGVPVSLLPDDMDGVAPIKRLRVATFGTEPGAAGWKTSPESWKAEVSPATGFLRLFVDLAAEELVTVALLDPAPSALRLDKNGRFGGQ